MIDQIMALLFHRKLAALYAPMPWDLSFLNHWMERTNMGSVHVHGKDSDMESSEDWHTDLLSLKTRPPDDICFQWVNDTATHWYHYMLGRHIRYVQTSMNFVGSALTQKKGSGI